MRLSREEVLHIARLARLGLDEAEIDKFREQLSNLLEHFQALQKVDTTGVIPTIQSTALQNVIRNDVSQTSLTPDQVLSNAPQKENDFFRVRHILG